MLNSKRVHGVGVKMVPKAGLGLGGKGDRTQKEKRGRWGVLILLR
jgi:hypothetical protein